MSRSGKVLFVLALVTVIGLGSLSVVAKGGPPKPGKCPDRFIFCLDVWDPVICDDGKTYSNECYARRACATGCVSTGGGPIPL